MKYLLKDEDVANVVLELKQDHSFALDVEIFITAQIEIEGDINEDIEGVDEKHTGNWKVEGDNVVLTFESHPDVNTLFNPQLDQHNTIKILNPRTVAFDQDAEMITVRGVYLQKIK